MGALHKTVPAYEWIIHFILLYELGARYTAQSHTDVKDKIGI